MKRIKHHRMGWLENPIPANHGETLSEVITNLEGEDVEYLAIFTKNGEKLCESTNLSPETAYTTLEDKKKVLAQGGRCIIVHNHPGEEVVGFSYADFMADLCYDMSYSVVVTREYCLAMEYPKKVDKKTKERIVKFLDNFSTNDSRDYTLNLFSMEDGPDVDFDARTPGTTGVLRCAALAQEFGFTFWIAYANQGGRILLSRLQL